jgi:hypothetical protein
MDSSNEWSKATWDVVGGWLNNYCSTVPDPGGDGPWIPDMDAVRLALDSVESAWRAIQPPTPVKT